MAPDRGLPRQSPLQTTADDASAPWLPAWLSVTAVAAVFATAQDAVLLQRKRGFFTGGFLSVDHVKSPLEGAAFIVASLATDFACLGVLTALLLWTLARMRVGSRVAWTLALAFSLAPTVAANIVTYQLLAYLGDAFDFALMFDLAGRSPSEILAVSAPHLVGYAAGAVAVLVAGGGLLWWALRRRSAPTLVRFPAGRAAAVSLLVLTLVAAGTTVVRTRSDVLDDGLRRKPSGRLLGIAVDTTSDVDGDGFGILGRVRDPDPLDGTVSPYAVDWPGNGVDENGIAGDLPPDAARYLEGPSDAPRWTLRRDVVLVVLESFRADAVGARVNGVPVTPVLDALASSGFAAEHAYSHNGYTVQSRRHIFTGSLADARGRTTLVDDFARNGYQTAYFSAQDDSFGGPAASVGLERADAGFDARAARHERYTTFATPGSLAIPAQSLVQRVRDFLTDRKDERPLFLYVNFHDTHFPYHHRALTQILRTPVLEQAAIGPSTAPALRQMYLNTAANVDRAVGDVMEAVRESSGTSPGVVVISDHGESLYDAGFLGHGYALDDAQTRIPMIVSGLPIAIEEPVGQSDLRDALWRAMQSADSTAPPRRAVNRARRVFQYLGNLDQPAQIASIGLDGRMVYDFRRGEFRSPSGAWRRPASLRDGDLEAFTTLVRWWEAMKLTTVSQR